MSYEVNGRCGCANCPVETCDCGCQAAVSAVLVSYAGAACNCGRTCGCDGAEQGCLCEE